MSVMEGDLALSTLMPLGPFQSILCSYCPASDLFPSLPLFLSIPRGTLSRLP